MGCGRYRTGLATVSALEQSLYDSRHRRLAVQYGTGREQSHPSPPFLPSSRGAVPANASLSLHWVVTALPALPCLIFPSTPARQAVPTFPFQFPLLVLLLLARALHLTLARAFHFIPPLLPSVLSSRLKLHHFLFSSSFLPFAHYLRPSFFHLSLLFRFLSSILSSFSFLRRLRLHRLASHRICKSYSSRIPSPPASAN